MEAEHDGASAVPVALPCARECCDERPVGTSVRREEIVADCDHLDVVRRPVGAESVGATCGDLLRQSRRPHPSGSPGGRSGAKELAREDGATDGVRRAAVDGASASAQQSRTIQAPRPSANKRPSIRKAPKRSRDSSHSLGETRRSQTANSKVHSLDKASEAPCRDALPLAATSRPPPPADAEMRSARRPAASAPCSAGVHASPNSAARAGGDTTSRAKESQVLRIRAEGDVAITPRSAKRKAAALDSPLDGTPLERSVSRGRRAEQPAGGAHEGSRPAKRPRSCSSGVSVRPYGASRLENVVVPDTTSAVAGPLHADDEYEQEVDQPLRESPQQKASTARSSAPPQPAERRAQVSDPEPAHEPAATPLEPALRPSRPGASRDSLQRNALPKTGIGGPPCHACHPGAVAMMGSQQAAVPMGGEPASMSHFHGPSALQGGTYQQRASLTSGTVQPNAQQWAAFRQQKVASYVADPYAQLAVPPEHLSNFSPFSPQVPAPPPFQLPPPSWYGGVMLGYTPVPLTPFPYASNPGYWHGASECGVSVSPRQSANNTPYRLDPFSMVPPAMTPSQLQSPGRSPADSCHGMMHALPPSYLHGFQQPGYVQAGVSGGGVGGGGVRASDPRFPPPPYKLPPAVQAQHLWQHQVQAQAFQQMMRSQYAMSQGGLRTSPAPSSNQAHRGAMAAPPERGDRSVVGAQASRSGVARGRAPREAVNHPNGANPVDADAASDGWSSIQSEDGECCAKVHK